MKLRILGAAALVVTFVGCGPSVEDVQNATTTAVTTVYDNAGRTGDSVGRMTVLTALGSGASTLSRQRLAELPLPNRELLAPLFAAPDLQLPAFGGAPVVSQSNEEAMHAAGQRIARFLRERIFTEDNVESRFGNDIVFRVTGEDVCVYEEYGTGEWVSSGPSCIAAFDLYEFRVRASRGASGLAVVVLVGPEKFEPVAFYLSRQLLGASLDLGETKKTYQYFAEVQGTTIALPEVMEGVVSVTAVRHGEDDYQIDFGVTRSVNIDQPTGTARTFVRIEAQPTPVVSARYRGPEKRLLVDVDLGVTDVGGPYYGTAGNQLAYHLGGASFSFDVKEGDTELLISNLGLGDEQTRYSLDDTALNAVDLNPNAGRRFDLRVTVAEDGMPILGVTPKLELSVAYRLEKLAADDPYVPAWAYQEQLWYLLDGENPSVKSIPYDSSTGTGGGLKVLSGTLTLQADEPGVAPVVVHAGQCLSRDPASTATHPFAGFLVADCG